MKFHIITLFPNLIEPYTQDSMIARAISAKRISVKFYNPRDFSKNKHKKADDKPYGGGPGMVMSADPILRAIDKIKKSLAKRKTPVKLKTIIFVPSGELFTNKIATKLSKQYTDIILICGRYEGIDARVRKALRATEISIGPYVLTGGELPAMVLLDAITRQIPGVLGDNLSLEENRISTKEMFTRPDEITYQGKKYKVPKVLLSGDHKKIDTWRKQQGR